MVYENMMRVMISLILKEDIQQSGPNVSITIVNHGLLPNKRVAIDFTSGDLLDGQYVISSVPDENTIVIIYPFSGTTQGDCTVSNLKIHEYVDVPGYLNLTINQLVMH